MRDGQVRLEMKRNLAIAEKQTHPGKASIQCVKRGFNGPKTRFTS